MACILSNINNERYRAFCVHTKKQHTHTQLPWLSQRQEVGEARLSAVVYRCGWLYTSIEQTTSEQHWSNPEPNGMHIIIHTNNEYYGALCVHTKKYTHITTLAVTKARGWRSAAGCCCIPLRLVVYCSCVLSALGPALEEEFYRWIQRSGSDRTYHTIWARWVVEPRHAGDATHLAVNTKSYFPRNDTWCSMTKCGRRTIYTTAHCYRVFCTTVLYAL